MQAIHACVLVHGLAVEILGVVGEGDNPLSHPLHVKVVPLSQDRLGDGDDDC